MSEDRYERWISNETIEHGFRPDLWTRAMELSGNDPTQAKIHYVSLRREELIQSGESIPDPDAPTPTKVPYRPPPRDFFTDHPTAVRLIGFGIAFGLILMGIAFLKYAATSRY